MFASSGVARPLGEGITEAGKHPSEVPWLSQRERDRHGIAAHDGRRRHQAATDDVPATAHHRPVLQHHRHQFGIQFGQDPPGIGTPHLVDVSRT